LFGSVPRRILVANLEVVLASLGYRVSREPFQVVAFKALGKKQRLHMKIETFGGSIVPKDAPIDLHIDLLSDLMKYHKSIAFDERIAEEMENLEEGINTSEWRARGGDAIAVCHICGKEMAGRFLVNHMKMHHSMDRVRKG